MKFLKKLLNILSLVLLLGGVTLILYTYLTNHTFVSKLTSLMTNADCKRGMLYILGGFVCLVVSFLLFSLSSKVNSSIRRKEKELMAKEKARREEEEARNRMLMEEAAKAKEEAERFKAEATHAQDLLSKTANIQEPPKE